MQSGGPNLAQQARESDSFVRQSDQALQIAHFSLLHGEVCEQLAALQKKHKEQQKQLKILQRNYGLLHDKHRVLAESAEEATALAADLAAILKLKPTRDAVTDLRMICNSASTTFGLKIPANFLPSARAGASDAAAPQKLPGVQAVQNELQIQSASPEATAGSQAYQQTPDRRLFDEEQEAQLLDVGEQTALNCCTQTDLAHENCNVQLLDLQRKLELSQLQLKDFNQRILPAKIEEIARYELLVRTLQSSQADATPELNALPLNAMRVDEERIQQQEALIRELKQQSLQLQSQLEEAERKCAEQGTQLLREQEQGKEKAAQLSAADSRLQEAQRMLASKIAAENALIGQKIKVEEELERQRSANREAAQLAALQEAKLVRRSRTVVHERARCCLMKGLAQHYLKAWRAVAERLSEKEAQFNAMLAELPLAFSAFRLESPVSDGQMSKIAKIQHALQAVEAKVQTLVRKRAQRRDASVNACDTAAAELLQRRKQQVIDVVNEHLRFLDDAQRLLGQICAESQSSDASFQLPGSELAGFELASSFLTRWQQCKDDTLRTVRFLNLMAQKLNEKCMRVAAQRDVMPLSPSLTQSGHSMEKPTRLERQLSKELERKERENQRVSAQNSQRSEEQLSKLQSENDRLRREVQRLKMGFYQIPEETEFPRRGAKSSAVSPRIEARAKKQQGRLQ